MGALAGKIPFSFATFLLASLALCGIPPFAGFFSKDEILWSAWSAPNGSMTLWLIGSVTSFMTAFYMFRAIFMTFFGPCNVPESKQHGIHEPPATMSAVLAILAFCSVVAGFIGLPNFWRELLGVSAPFYDFLAPVLGHAKAGEAAGQSAELLLMVIAVMVALSGILLAWLFFSYRREWSGKIKARAGYAHAVVSRGYFFDNVYQGVVVRSMDWLSESILARRLETTLHHGTLNKPSEGVHFASRLFSRLQTGNAQAYVFYVLIGLAMILWWGVARG
jgi:NADH-quinone oxidoreductase subunit L